MLRRILVALDHSAQNQYVFETAVSLARATDAALMLLHILDEDIEAELIENSPQIPKANNYSLSEEGELEFYQDNLVIKIGAGKSWEILPKMPNKQELEPNLVKLQAIQNELFVRSLKLGLLI